MADTIRQVDRTFKARMDLLTGQPGDLGFKYFTEKGVGVGWTRHLEALA